MEICKKQELEESLTILEDKNYMKLAQVVDFFLNCCVEKKIYYFCRPIVRWCNWQHVWFWSRRV